MKYIVIAILGSKYKPIVFLISPHTTAGAILDQLKVEDYVLDRIQPRYGTVQVGSNLHW